MQEAAHASERVKSIYELFADIYKLYGLFTATHSTVYIFQEVRIVPVATDSVRTP